jgi:hypothetical protein
MSEPTGIDFSALPEIDGTAMPGLSPQRTSRFDQDSSELDDRACWALQNVLTRRYISKDKQPELWSWIIEYRRKLASRLSELNLILVVDEAIEYAFTEQAEDESPWARKLLRKETLQLYDSVLALQLAKMARATPDVRVLISRDDMHALFAGIDNIRDRDEERFAKRIDAAIKKLVDVKILIDTDEDDNFVVSPVILSLMTAARIEALEAQFTALRPAATDDADSKGDSGIEGRDAAGEHGEPE